MESSLQLLHGILLWLGVTENPHCPRHLFSAFKHLAWFQTPSEFKKTHIQLVPQMGTCVCGGGTTLGFSGGHGGLERVMEEKCWRGQLLMSLLLGHTLSGWRRRLPSETRNVQRHCRQPETFSESHIALLHTQLKGAGCSDYQRAHKSKTFVSV